MPELVIQTLVCTFRCNPPFQEALWHDMHGIIYSPSPPKKNTRTNTVLFTHHPVVSLPTVFSHHHCFVYPSSCRFSSHCFFPSPLFWGPAFFQPHASFFQPHVFFSTSGVFFSTSGVLSLFQPRFFFFFNLTCLFLDLTFPQMSFFQPHISSFQPHMSSFQPCMSLCQPVMCPFHLL